MSIHRSDAPKQPVGFVEQTGSTVYISRTCDACGTKMFSGFHYVRHVAYKVVCAQCVTDKRLKVVPSKKKPSQGRGL